MLEAIANLLQEANAQHMQLIIRPEANGQISVIANTVLKPTTDKESKEALNLRSALTTPLCMSGDKGELDVSFCEELTGFARAYETGAMQHSTMLDATATMQKATKTAETKSGNTATVAQPKASESKAEQPKTAPATESPSEDTFLSDDAESL